MALTEWYVNDAGSGTGTGTTEANAMSYATFTDYMVTGGSKTAAAGDRFNIKGAITGRTTTTDTWVNGGTVTSPVIVRGYNSTIGDLTSVTRTNGNGPLVVTNYPTISYTTGKINVTGNFIIIEALQISSANATASQGTVILTGTDIFIKRCYVFNSSTSANANGIFITSGTRSSVIDCDVSLTGGSGGNSPINETAATGVRVIGNRVKGGGFAGINLGTGAVCLFNTVYSSGAIGIRVADVGYVVMYNTIVGSTTDGINVVTGLGSSGIIIGNMSTDNTGDGIDMVSTANAAFASNNRTRDNATGYNNAGDWLTATKYNDVTTDTGGPETDYVNSGGNDYRLIRSSPATGAGNPLYLDIGALQRQEQVGGFMIQ